MTRRPTLRGSAPWSAQGMRGNAAPGAPLRNAIRAQVAEAVDKAIASARYWCRLQDLNL